MSEDILEFQEMPETDQIKIFSGEILTFLKPASPGGWWAAPPILGLAADTL